MVSPPAKSKTPRPVVGSNAVDLLRTRRAGPVAPRRDAERKRHPSCHKLNCRPGLEPGPYRVVLSEKSRWPELPHRPVAMGPGSRFARPGRADYYTAAVVTPPSTTMLWPVMKLEASE